MRRRTLGPPSGARVYELSRRGAELEPVLVELARWGSRGPLPTEGELSVDALALALRVTFRGDGLRARIGLRLDADELTATADGDTFTIMRGAQGDADAAITASAATLRDIVFGG